MRKRTLGVLGGMLLSVAFLVIAISYAFIAPMSAHAGQGPGDGGSGNSGEVEVVPPPAQQNIDNDIILVTLQSGVNGNEEEFYNSSDPIVESITRGDPLPQNVFERYGWRFTYWQTKTPMAYIDDPETPVVETTTGIRFDNEETTENITLSEITMEAQWERINYEVNFIAYTNEQNNTEADRIDVTNAPVNDENFNRATITYGSGLDDGQDLEKQYVPEIPTLFGEDYKFDGWYLTQEDANAKATGKRLYNLNHVLDYEESENIFKSSASNTINLYARWEKRTYTIIFDRNRPTRNDIVAPENDGVGQFMPNMEAKRTETPELINNTYSVTGWRFMGWNTSDNRFDGIYTGAVVYENGDEINANLAKADQAATLYAMWLQNEYTITFDLDHGNGLLSDIDATYDTTNKTALPNTNLTKEGYWFDGWKTENGLFINDYEDTDALNLTPEHQGIAVLKAVWINKRYDITFNVGLGDDVSESVDGETGLTIITDQNGNKVTIGSTTMASAPYGRGLDNDTYNPTREGHTFLGWYVLQTPNIYGPEFAAWQEAASANIGLITEENWKLLYDAGYEMDEFGLIKTPVIDYINFDRATTLQNIIDFDDLIGDGDNNTIITGTRTSATDDVNVTLFARWYRYEYTVTYEANYEPQEGLQTQKMHLGNGEYRLSVPVRPSFVFTGWFDSPDPIYPNSNQGRQITDELGYPLADDPSVWWIQKDITLYAHFVTKPEGTLTIVTYDDEHGQIRWGEYVIDEDFSFSFTPTPRANFEFMGLVYEDGKEVLYSLEDGKYKIDASRTSGKRLKIHVVWEHI